MQCLCVAGTIAKCLLTGGVPLQEVFVGRGWPVLSIPDVRHKITLSKHCTTVDNILHEELLNVSLTN